MRIRPTVVLLALALLAPAVARAEPTSAEIAVARRLFHEASALEKSKDYAHAADKLREALAIKETPGLRYHLAYCEEQQGRLVAALVDYDRADEMITDGAKAPDVQALLGPARDALRKRVPTLTVTVTVAGDAGGAALSIDGKAMAATMIGQPVPLDPGKHHVEVTAEGHAPFTADVTLAEGDRKTQAATLAAAAAAPAAPVAAVADPAPPPGAPPAADKGHGIPLRTIVIGAEAVVTLAALGTGIGYTLAKSSAQSRADDAQASIDRLAPGNTGACNTPSSDLASPCSDLATALDDRKSAGNIATVGFIGAGVGAVATVATFFLWKPSPATSAAVHVAPVAGGGFAGSVTGTF